MHQKFGILFAHAGHPHHPAVPDFAEHLLLGVGVVAVVALLLTAIQHFKKSKARRTAPTKNQP